ncbi:MAG: DUF1801 domain-containing protein [Flavobacteriales bacterium]
MKTKATNTTDYFAGLAEDRRFALGTIRQMILDIWPSVVEDMSLGMPTYHLDGEAFCAIASQKNFMALYIMPYDLLNAFTLDLRIYDTGKSCIRFKRLEPATLELFDRIIKYTGSQMHTSRFHGKPENMRYNGKAH